jgi:hypothetical protein
MNVIVRGMYPVRNQAAAQTEFSFQICFAEPSAMYAVLAISAADLQARTGCLSNTPMETTSTKGDLVHRKMPAFMEYKLKAIKAVNEKMTSTGKMAEVATMVVLMSFLFLEVRSQMRVFKIKGESTLRIAANSSSQSPAIKMSYQDM